MRKKEQIWKRLNIDQEQAVNAWLLGMGSLIGFMILSALGWSLYYKKMILFRHIGFHPAWAKAVFSSWIIAALPLLVVMYKQADKIFKSAVIRQNRETDRKSVV